MEINLDPKYKKELKPGMSLINKHDEWKFIELMLSGTKGGDPTQGFLTHELGTDVIKFYTVDELIADWEPLQK